MKLPDLDQLEFIPGSGAGSGSCIFEGVGKDIGEIPVFISQGPVRRQETTPVTLTGKM